MPTPDPPINTSLPPTFLHHSEMPVSRSSLSLWHNRQGALQRLNPPWEHVNVIDSQPVKNGSRSRFLIRIAPGLWRQWIAEHRDVREDGSFSDVQICGPFANWHHQHLFLEHPDHTEHSILEDRITCQLPGGPLINKPAKPFLKRRLKRLFKYRHAVTRGDLQRWQEFPQSKPLHILISGATGLIGTTLIAVLQQAGHKITRLSRKPGPNTIVWNPAAAELNLNGSPHFDAVIHLAGENVAAGRWNAERKKRILESRTKSGHLLATTVAALPSPPKTFISASGISGYPANGLAHDEETAIDESTFLGKVVKDWESAANPAREAGMRVVHIRLAAVLSPTGGALGKLTPIFRTGLGGPIGTGKFAFSWISIDDAIDIFHRAVVDETMHGAYNAVAPESVNNHTFSRTLGRILRRPAILPVPPILLRILFGQMANETILANINAIPSRLNNINHTFRHPRLKDALAYLFGR